jgi:hypothetical protein
MNKLLKFVDSFMKILVVIVVTHGLICISLSYVLAFMGYSEVVESLSSTMVTEVIAPVTIYGITKTIENVSKYNNWIDRFRSHEEDEECTP